MTAPDLACLAAAFEKRSVAAQRGAERVEVVLSPRDEKHLVVVLGERRSQQTPDRTCTEDDETRSTA